MVGVFFLFVRYVNLSTFRPLALTLNDEISSDSTDYTIKPTVEPKHNKNPLRRFSLIPRLRKAFSDRKSEHDEEKRTPFTFRPRISLKQDYDKEVSSSLKKESKEDSNSFSLRKFFKSKENKNKRSSLEVETEKKLGDFAQAEEPALNYRLRYFYSEKKLKALIRTYLLEQRKRLEVPDREGYLDTITHCISSYFSGNSQGAILFTILTSLMTRGFEKFSAGVPRQRVDIFNLHDNENCFDVQDLYLAIEKWKELSLDVEFDKDKMMSCLEEARRKLVTQFNGAEALSVLNEIEDHFSSGLDFFLKNNS